MFGTFRFNNALNEAEYVELSRDAGVDARGYTLLVSQDDPVHNECPVVTVQCAYQLNMHHRHAISAVPAR